MASDQRYFRLGRRRRVKSHLTRDTCTRMYNIISRIFHRARKMRRSTFSN